LISILDRINALRSERHWSEYQLADKSSVPQSTISSWYRKGMIPSFTSLDKICVAFGITLSQFFADESELIAVSPEQKIMLNKWNSLTAEQKDALLGFLNTL